MRAVGSTISGGPRYQDDEGLGLPREKRETAEEVRARMEAKAEAARARSPWARTPKDIPEARVMGDELVNPGYAEVAFNAPAPAPALDETFETFDRAARPKATHRCPVCGGTFATAQGLGGHKRIHNGTPAAAALAVPQPPQGASEEARAVGIPSPAPRPAGTTPRPIPRPITPPPSNAGPRRPVDRAEIVREYVEDGETIGAIAARRHHSKSTVREVLMSTPGVVLRDDRTAVPRPAAVATTDAVAVHVEPVAPPQCVETVAEELCVLDDGHDGAHETAAQHLEHSAADRAEAAPAAAVVVLPAPRQAVDPAAFGDDDIESVLGAMTEFIEHLPPGITHHPVLGDVVDRLNRGTLAIRAAIGGTR